MSEIIVPQQELIIPKAFIVGGNSENARFIEPLAQAFELGDHLPRVL